VRSIQLTAGCIWLATALVVSSSVDGADDELTVKELSKLNGVWAVTSAVNSGHKSEARELKNVRLIIRRKYLEIRRGKESEKYTLTIDPTKSPKQLTIHRTVDNKTETIPAIYEFDGKTLKMCCTSNGKPRPTQFVSNSENGAELLTFEQEVEKPADQR
jgi:uncharacterized protein (TIGR03067 family)